MTVYGIEVTITAFVDGHQPGWVKCIFLDAHGKEWSILEKGPVVYEDYLDEKSLYPIKGFVAATIKNRRMNENDKEIVTIDTGLPWGIHAEGGETVFEVFADIINTYTYND